MYEKLDATLPGMEDSKIFSKVAGGGHYCRSDFKIAAAAGARRGNFLPFPLNSLTVQVIKHVAGASHPRQVSLAPD